MIDPNNPKAIAAGGQLPMYTIYRNPADYPGKFVVRLHLVPGGATDYGFVTDTLERARQAVPPGLFCQPRQEGDDPVIVEVWF